ncbi:MAG: hypothetical protein QXZ63_05345 [Sulfolobales archaeon]
MRLDLWMLNVVIALLSAINTIAWGFVIRELGDPKLTIEFVIRLVFNKYFILAMVSAFAASVLSYVILREFGVLAGRFFLSLSTVAIIIASIIVLRESYDLKTWIGVSLIIIGSLILGR